MKKPFYTLFLALLCLNTMHAQDFIDLAKVSYSNTQLTYEDDETNSLTSFNAGFTLPL